MLKHSSMLRLVAALALLAGVSGCVVPGAIAYKLFGPTPIPPRYKVPKQQPLLVLVENAHSGSVALPETDALAGVLFEDLKEHQVAPMIDPTLIHDLRDRDPVKFGKMSISDIGRALGARQVLYVNVHTMDIEQPPASELVRVKLSLKIRMIDTTTASTIWPEAGDDESFDRETSWKRIESTTSRSTLNQDILRESGVALARWFYEYQPETMQEENQDMRLR